MQDVKIDEEYEGKKNGDGGTKWKRGMRGKK